MERQSQWWSGPEQESLRVTTGCMYIHKYIFTYIPHMYQGLSDCKQIKNEYQVYSESSLDLFQSAKVLPNHHYALHIPEQLQQWGPLLGISEFHGKRLNGVLQRCKTNSNRMFALIAFSICFWHNTNTTCT